jgi:hypothetical protein
MRVYFPTIISFAIILSVVTSVFYLFFFRSLESIPLDGGWIGFVFMFANGFLLSHLLVKERVGTTERLLLSIGLGFGLNFAVLILIGVLWEFSMMTIILTQVFLFLALLTAAAYRGLQPNFNGFSRLIKKISRMPQLNTLQAILLIVISIYAIAALYKTVSLPATEWDSLAYGVNYAKIIFERGNIPLIAGPSIGLEMSANYPPGVQLIAVQFYVLAGSANDFYYRMLSPIFGLATMIATYKFTLAVRKSKNTSVFAIFTLSAIPTFWELFIQETYLMGLALMMTLSALFFYKAYSSNNSKAGKYEVLGTLFCCFSALTSYMGLFSFGILMLYAINKRLSLKRFTWLSALPLVITLPWYARNFLLLGNPLYPFFGIGSYLDPLLKDSTMQHFQNYTTIPVYGWISTTCKVGAVLLVLAIAYITIAKRKNFLGRISFERRILANNFLVILPLYLLLTSAIIMALHLPFPRYLIIALPCLAVVSSATIKFLFTIHKLANIVAVALISLIIISSVAMLPYINSVKPAPQPADDAWSYLSHVHEEADAWNWINMNTPKDARIATYDIKEYYIERDILPLDGYESVPLYKIGTIDESINFLEDRNVTYVLSVPWAAPSDPRMPPAYKWCILTRYLGDPRYLPLVYVGLNGTAVYHVGPIEEKTAYKFFTQENFVAPMKYVTINLTMTNNTIPYSCQLYMPIPVDYREGLMVASVNSNSHLVDVELWNGLIPLGINTNPLEKFTLVEKWHIQSATSSGIEDSSFVWQIDRAGYFTIRIIDREETFKENFNVTVKLGFFN